VLGSFPITTAPFNTTDKEGWAVNVQSDIVEIVDIRVFAVCIKNIPNLASIEG
jgi:hypothetical protein